MHEHVFVHAQVKGNVAELGIATESARLGLAVLKPLTEQEPYDLVLGIGGKLFRVQCKWGQLKGDVIHVRLRSSYHSPTRGYVTSAYDESEIDALAIYCGELSRAYLVPVARIAGLGMFSLRLTAARNKQRASLNWAADYEFPGAVAQLEERVAGSDEVRGSSPLSSTREGLEVAGSPEEVGAHQFRNRFGFYLERAAGGTEILVLRRGRPLARLVSADLNPAAPAADV